MLQAYIYYLSDDQINRHIITIKITTTAAKKHKS